MWHRFSEYYAEIKIGTTADSPGKDQEENDATADELKGAVGGLLHLKIARRNNREDNEIR